MDVEGSQKQSLQPDITTCYILLSTILSSKNTSSLKLHEQKLLQLSKKKQFIHILLAILTLPQANDNIIKMAIQYVKIYLRTSLIYQEIKSVIRSIWVVIDYVGKSGIKLRYKNELIEKVAFILSKTRFKSLQTQCKNKLQQLLTNTIAAASSSSTNMQQVRERPSIQFNTSQNNLQFIALFCRLVIDSIDKEYKNHSLFLTRNLTLFISIVGGFAANVNQTAHKADEQQVQYHVEVLVIFIDLLHSWINKIKLAGQSISAIINTPQLPLIITSCLAISPQKNTFPYPLFYLQLGQLSTQSCLSTKMHSLKYETLRLLNKCIKNTFFISYNNNDGNNRLKDGVQMPMNTHTHTHTQQVCQNLNNIYLYGACEDYLRMFVKSVSEMLGRCCWWQFGSWRLVEIVVEVAVFVTSILKAKTMYAVLLELKPNIIFNICIKLLTLSPTQLTISTDQPQQFLNCLYNTIQKPELSSSQNNKQSSLSTSTVSTSAISISKVMQQLQKQQKQQQEYQQQFNYLKSTIMDMLIHYCFFIDGVISQLVQMGLEVLGQEEGRDDEMFVCFIVLAGLWRNIYSHWNCLCLIGKYVITRVGTFNFIQINTKQTNIKYTLLLLLLQTYLPQLQSQTQNLLPSTLLLSTNILCSPTCDETHKLIACQLIKTVFIINQQNKQKNKHKNNQEFDIISDADISNMLNVLSQCLQPSNVNARLVNCLDRVVGEALGFLASRGKSQGGNQRNVLEDDEILEIQVNQMEQEDKKNVQNANYEEYVQPINKIIDKTLALVLTLSTQSISGNDKIILNNLMDLLLKISSNITKFPPIVSYIRDKISPLLSTFLKQDNPMFQTLPQILTELINCSKQISNTQINAFRFIFNAFSTGPRKLSLSLCSFSFLQHLLMYGSQTIVQSQSSKQFISAIISMSITSIRQESIDQIIVRGEGEMIQGVLIMQTAIVCLARGFTKGLWGRMVDCLIEKIGKGGIRYDFMKAEIYINLGLIVGLAHGFIDASKLVDIVSQLSKCHYYFTYPNTTKLSIIALTQLLPICLSNPTLNSQTVPILSCTLILIKLVQQKKDKSLFNQQYDSEEQAYIKIKQKCLNPLNKIDEFQLFNIQINKIRNMYADHMKNIQLELMPILKRVLSYVGGVRRVAGDVRVIYKVKR